MINLTNANGPALMPITDETMNPLNAPKGYRYIGVQIRDARRMLKNLARENPDSNLAVRFGACQYMFLLRDDLGCASVEPGSVTWQAAETWVEAVGDPWVILEAIEALDGNAKLARWADELTQATGVDLPRVVEEDELAVFLSVVQAVIADQNGLTGPRIETSDDCRAWYAVVSGTNRNYGQLVRWLGGDRYAWFPVRFEDDVRLADAVAWASGLGLVVNGDK